MRCARKQTQQHGPARDYGRHGKRHSTRFTCAKAGSKKVGRELRLNALLWRLRSRPRRYSRGHGDTSVETFVSVLTGRA